MSHRRTMYNMAGLAITFLLMTSCGGSSNGRSGGNVSATYTAFLNPVLVTILGYTGDAMEPFISKDGHYLFFNNKNDPSINTDIYYASRIDDQTFTYLGPVLGVNSPELDAVASLDELGNFYWISTRSYANTLATVYGGQFNAGTVSNVGIVSGISLQKTGEVNFDAEISADGQTLWFDDGDYSTGSLTSASIAVASRQGAAFVRQVNSATILSAVNTSDLNYAPSISVDGLELFFTRVSTAPGSTPALYRSARTDPSAAFAPAEILAVATGFVEAPSLSEDGHLLYFHKLENGKFVIYKMQR